KRASRDPLNPLAPPGRRLKGIREILRIVYHLTVEELHNANGECRPILVVNFVLRNPKITRSHYSPDLETRRLTRTMTPQSLQIASPEDALTRLRVIANG